MRPNLSRMTFGRCRHHHFRCTEPPSSRQSDPVRCSGLSFLGKHEAAGVHYATWRFGARLAHGNLTSAIARPRPPHWSTHVWRSSGLPGCACALCGLAALVAAIGQGRGPQSTRLMRSVLDSLRRRWPGARRRLSVVRALVNAGQPDLQVNPILGNGKSRCEDGDHL